MYVCHVICNYTIPGTVWRNQQRSRTITSLTFDASRSRTGRNVSKHDRPILDNYPVRFVSKQQIRLFAKNCSALELPPNKSLQRTFDPPPIFAFAKTGVASNAAEFRRWVVTQPLRIMLRSSLRRKAPAVFWCPVSHCSAI